MGRMVEMAGLGWLVECSWATKAKQVERAVMNKRNLGWLPRGSEPKLKME
jgi:hypothetical protein